MVDADDVDDVELLEERVVVVDVDEALVVVVVVVGVADTQLTS